MSARHPTARPGLRLALLAGTMAVLPQAARAQEVQTGMDLSITAEAVNNPYLTDANSSWVGAGTIEARPWLRRSDEKDSLQLRGLARVRGFTSRYDPETAFGADLEATSRLSPRTTAYGRASFLTTNRRTPFDVLTPRPGLTDPIVPPEGTVPVAGPILVLPGEDVTLLGRPGRITTSSVGAGLSHQIDPSSTLGYNVDYRRLDAGSGLTGIGYQSASLGAQYTRQLRPRTKVGLAGTASKTRYEQNRPSATTYSLAVMLDQQFGRYWSLNASAGVSSTRAAGNGFYRGYSAVTPIASVSLCHQPVRKNLCLSYTRSQQPSFLGDVRTSDAASLNYSEQLSQRRRVDLSASYARSLGDRAAAQFPNVEALSVRGAFTQTINDRLEGFLSASVSKSYGGYLSRKPSIALGAGVRIRLGTRR